MNKIIKFGEYAEGYNIPVLNEREIRAAAGILFLATFTSLMFILFEENFVPIKYVITLFLIDFIIRVFINPKFSPTLILGRLMVRNQTPEYVGWVLWLSLFLSSNPLMIISVKSLTPCLEKTILSNPNNRELSGLSYGDTC